MKLLGLLVSVSAFAAFGGMMVSGELYNRAVSRLQLYPMAECAAGQRNRAVLDGKGPPVCTTSKGASDV